jgi:uncharacterized protein YbcI
MTTDNSIHYRGFMSALQDKIPNKTTLVNAVTDMLAIDKDAVYRRLRGEVNFTFSEMAVISRNLGISLDNIAGIENMQSRPAKMNISRQVDLTEIDYKIFEDFLNVLESIKDEPNTKLMESTNLIPNYFYYDYENITRFVLFIWNQASSYGSALPYHKIIIPERLRILQKECGKYARNIKSTVFMLDNMIFLRLVANIKYFIKVHLIPEDGALLIKKDLTALLENLENIAVTGKYADTGNEVLIFISDISIATNYSFIESKNLHISYLKAYLLNATVAMDDEVFNETKSWIRAVQRMSTLISVSGEKVRTAFFDEQRKIIDTL